LQGLDPEFPIVDQCLFILGCFEAFENREVIEVMPNGLYIALHERQVALVPIDSPPHMANGPEWAANDLPR
jgi:hypothetical protein